jgi:hypothetical protein
VVPSLRPLASSQIREPRQWGKHPVSSTPLCYQNTWGWGPCACHMPSDYSDGTGGYSESSAKTKIVHIKPSLCPSFQLGCSLGGYTVGTTVGFWVTSIVTELPHKWWVRLPGSGSGDSRWSENACKHTYKAFKTIISLKIKLLHFSLKITMIRSRRFFKR